MAITTIGGYYIRPRKKKKRGTKHLTLRFALLGTVPSKKNNQIAITRLDDAIRRMNYFLQQGNGLIDRAQCQEVLDLVRSMIVPSNRFQKWHKKSLEDIKRQRDDWTRHVHARGLTWPLAGCSISVYHYWKDDRIRDNSNKLESIQDLLVDAGILVDDAWQHLSPVVTDADSYIGELRDHTTVINITVYY
jgi:hypothetical protein